MNTRGSGKTETIERTKSYLCRLHIFSILSMTLLLFSGLTPSAYALVRVDSTWIQQNSSQGALFFNQTGETYRFETDFSAAGTAVFVISNNITIDLNGHTIVFGTSDRDGTMGINLLRARTSHSLGADDVNYSQTAGGGTGGDNCTIKNGRIVWGGASGSWAVPIGAYRGPNNTGPTITNMYLETGGRDASCIHCYWADFNVNNSYCKNNSSATNNRHSGPASFKTEGTVVAYNNIVIGGNSAIVCGSGSTIYNNVLRHSSFATNGYGVWLYRNSNVSAYNNIIAPMNGRGILYNAGSNHEAYGNLIVAHEEPNQEYGGTLNPPALRMRYNASDINFHDNKCLVIGGTDLTGASGAYLSNDASMRNTIQNNEFYAILRGETSTRKYANGITFERQGGESGNAADVISKNTFASNNYLIRLAGYDGGCYQDAIKNNNLLWISGDNAYGWFVNAIDDSKYNYSYPSTNNYVRSSELVSLKNTIKSEVGSLVSGVPNNNGRHTFYTGYYNYDSFIEIINGYLGSGVTMDIADVYVETSSGSAIEIAIGHFLHVIAQDSNGNSIVNKTISVHDNTGQVYSGQTNNSGLATLELIDHVLLKSDAGSSVSKADRTGHYATIAGHGSVTLPLAIAQNENNPYVLRFGGSAVPDTDPPEKPKNLRVGKK